MGVQNPQPESVAFGSIQMVDFINLKESFKYSVKFKTKFGTIKFLRKLKVRAKMVWATKKLLKKIRKR